MATTPEMKKEKDTRNSDASMVLSKKKKKSTSTDRGDCKARLAVTSEKVPMGPQSMVPKNCHKMKKKTRMNGV